MHFSWQKLGYELILNWEQSIQLTILFSGKNQRSPYTLMAFEARTGSSNATFGAAFCPKLHQSSADGFRTLQYSLVQDHICNSFCLFFTWFVILSTSWHKKKNFGK